MKNSFCCKKRTETMPENDISYYEQRLQREIESLDSQIQKLRDEQNALKRQLVKARWENSAIKDVSRKNSANRVMIEQRILAELERNPTATTTRKLYQTALVANFELRENTFRTYLHRMKQKGLIESPNRGRWRLPQRRL